eukprot:COSAG01_NODE_6256_length_3768_cov_2.852548_3_plen_323_part_00
MRIAVYVLSPIAKPIAKGLDYMLGHEIKTLRRVDWLARFELDVEHFEDAKMAEHHTAEAGEQPLTRDELKFMQGCLGLFSKRVSDIGQDDTPIMVDIDNAVTLQLNDRLDDEKMQEILRHGFSRMPVLASGHIVGIVLVKNLITLDPEDAVPISALFEEERAHQQERELRRASTSAEVQKWDTAHTAKVLTRVVRVHKDISIFALIDLFQALRSQMAVVYDYRLDGSGSSRAAATVAGERELSELSDKSVTVALRRAFNDGHVLDYTQREHAGELPATEGLQLLGLTTLEDIIEEIFGEQFVDETGNWPGRWRTCYGAPPTE